jgi:outer membrane protein TolC
LERDLANSWRNYQTSLFILEAEKVNLKIAHLNLERTNAQFKVGQITSVEFRQAQLNLLTAATSSNTAKYDAKAIEMLLFQLSGELLEVQF